MWRLLWIAALLPQSCLLAAQTKPLKPAYDFSWSRDERIKLAESAAPPEVSSKATIYTLDSTGYVKVREGTNGFSCFVDRQTPLNLEPTRRGQRNHVAHSVVRRESAGRG